MKRILLLLLLFPALLFAQTDLKNDVSARSFRPYELTTAQLATVAGDLTASHEGAIFYDTTTGEFKYWNGSAFQGLVPAGSGYWTESGGNVYRASGNVGIGTASPSVRLHVASTSEVFRLQTTGADKAVNYMSYYDGGGLTGILGFSAGSDDNMILWNGTATGDLSLWSNALQRMTIKAAGDVGIGTTTPLVKLDVSGGNSYVRNGTSGAQHRIYDTFTDSSNGEWASMGFATTANTFVINTDGNGTGSASGPAQNIAMQTNGGNVGVGTTAPGTKLAVAGVTTQIDTSAPTPAAGRSYLYSVSGELTAMDSAGNSFSLTQPAPMGEVNYFNLTGITVAIASQSTTGTNNMAKAAPTTALTANGYQFDNGGANDGRLRYIGPGTRTFHTAYSVSFSGGANDTFTVAIAKNGTPVTTGTVAMRKMGSGGDVGSTAGHTMVTLSTNDYIEVFFGNTSDADDPTLHSLNIFAGTMRPTN
jgi:hypothetical protein